MKDNKIKVICIEKNKIFDSIKEAGKYYNIDPSGISKVLKGKQKTAGGYTWKKYIEENNKIKKLKLKTNNEILTPDEYKYWLNKFLKESKCSMEELNESIHQLYLSIKNEIF